MKISTQREALFTQLQTVTVVCVLVKRGRFLTATPLFQRGGQMTIPAKDAGRARPGSMVLVGGGKRGPRVIRELGDPERARDVVEAIMVDRGLRRSFPRAVEEEARGSAGRGRSPADLTASAHVHDRPGVGARLRRRDLGAARGRPRAAVGSHRRRDRVRAAGHGARGGGLPARHERLRPRERSSRCCRRRCRTRPAACAASGPQCGDGRARDGRGPGRERRRSTARVIRSDARLEYPQVDRIFAGEERAEEPWADALAAARAVAAALRERRARRGSLEVESDEPQFEFDDRGDVVARPARGADRVAHADRGADDPRQRAGGDAARRAAAPDALPRARAPRPRAGRVAGGAARVARRGRPRRCRSR